MIFTLTADSVKVKCVCHWQAMESLDLMSFRYGGVNITGFSLKQMPSGWVKSSGTSTAASNIVTDESSQYSV